MTKNNALTIKQANFVSEYLNNDYNASKAYQTAFKTSNKDMAKVEAYRLLKEQKIIDKIQEIDTPYRTLARENGLDKASIVLKIKSIIENGNAREQLAAIMNISRLCGYLNNKKKAFEYNELEEPEPRIDLSSLTEEQRIIERRRLLKEL